MGARNHEVIGLSYRPASTGGIDSLESITVLFKSLKVPSQKMLWSASVVKVAGSTPMREKGQF
jgi:hypothetical protein